MGELSHHFGEWQGLGGCKIGWACEKFDVYVSLAGLGNPTFEMRGVAFVNPHVGC